MARTDDISLYGSWAQGVLEKIISVDVSAGDVVVEGLYRIIMVTTAGDVAITQHDGADEVLPALQPGVQYVFSAATIRQTGTVATGIKLLR
ncbi:hypothetical protein [Roseobacter sp.]|uniref:spike base protein, RCAP_Rcc01079 family n=1 Tax=Roseobacter sp. TaxID=1907202 RepID=UPI002966CBB8|nr:hypothetical protein [Roseobacter sp.]MDW3181735.1 hypothetical protein [Roseobacter sp.]